MTGFRTLTLREMREGRAVLAAAAVAAVIPLGVQLLAGAEGGADIREITAWFVAVVLAGGFGLLLGATVLARDLAEGRLGFYFAQPVSGAAIWTAKMLAATGLALAAGLLPVAAAFLAGFVPGAGGHGVGGGWAQSLAVVAGLAVLGVALGHAASVMVRSRSRWQVLDVVGLVLVAAGVWWAIGTLRRAWAPKAMMVEVAAVIATVPLALLVAGAVQTTRGRTEIVRGHRLLSVTLWSLLGVVTLLLVVGARWVVTPGPDDLVAIETVATAPVGSCLVLEGEAWGRGDLVSGFLLDAANGGWLRLRDRRYWPSRATFSADGRRAAWLVPTGDPEGRRGEVVIGELGDAEPRIVPTTVGLTPAWTSTLALDASGDRLAVLSEGNVSVLTVPDCRLVAAARLPVDGISVRAFFVAPGLLRIYAWQGRSNETKPLWIGELNVATRRLEATGTIELLRYNWGARLDSNVQRLVILQAAPDESRRVTLFDARTGAELAELARPGWRVRTSALFLANGGVALAEERDDERRVRVVGRDGAERVVDLPTEDSYCWVGGEATPGIVMVGAAPIDGFNARSWRSYLVDLASGKTRDLGPGAPGLVQYSRLLTTLPPGSVGTRVINTGSTLELLDPSLKLTTVIAGSR